MSPLEFVVPDVIDNDVLDAGAADIVTVAFVTGLPTELVTNTTATV
jgi:hypothetical protein